jgi:uncharacterized protein YdaU (DUF1376 family)
VKEIRPWYRWWWHRYSNAEAVLEFRLSTCPSSAHGCYRNLLDQMWQMGGRIPTNRQILWSLAGCGSLQEYEVVADYVEKCFTKSGDGLWFTSETLTEEWDSATEILDKKREAGRKGGLSRGKHQLSTPLAELEHNSSTPQASSSSSSSSSNKKPRRAGEFNSTEAAMGYCHTFDVVGEKNIQKIKEAVELQIQKCPSDTPQIVAQRFIDLRREFESTPGVVFEWTPVSFITSGTWCNKESWTNGTSKQLDSASSTAEVRADRSAKAIKGAFDKFR